ncbi:MAG: hypothetical protein ABEJ78_01965 [Haloferacaceae archaeon]
MPEHTDAAEASDGSRIGQYVPECPIADCDVAFLGATEDDVVDHVLTEHEDLVHPHWTDGDVTASYALSRLVQEAEGPKHVERPSSELPPSLASFLDAYLVYVFLGMLILLLGWPFLVRIVAG